MSEAIEAFRKGKLNKVIIRKWKEAFVSYGLKVSLGETKVIVIGGITKDGLSKITFDPCQFCTLRVKTNSVVCVQRGM